jgi:hypothetical protein
MAKPKKTKKRKNKTRKKNFRLIKVLLIIVFITFTSLYLFVLSYQKNIKQAFVDQLNKYLITEVKISDVHISVFKKFPHISLVLDDIRIPDPNNEKELLADFENIYLTLDIIQILKKNYLVERLIIENGNLSLKKDESGQVNYQIWKVEDETEPSSEMNFDLKKILIKNVTLSYSDIQADLNFNTSVDKIDLKGKLKNEVFLVNISAEMLFNQLTNGKITYLKNNEVNLKTNIKVNQADNTFALENANIELDNLLFSIGGDFILANNSSYFNLNFEGQKIDILRILSVLPESVSENLNDYKTKGNIDINGIVVGNLNKTEKPAIKLNYELVDGEIINKQNKLSLERITLKGEYSNGEKHNNTSSIVKISALYAFLDKNEIKGSLVINDFDNPFLNTEISSNLDVSKISQFLNIKDISNLSGFADINLKYKGKLDNINEANNNVISSIQIRNLGFKISETKQQVEEINGQIAFNGKDLTIRNLNGKINKSDISLDGVILNFIPFITKENQKLIVSANLNSQHFVLDNFLSPSETENQSEGQSRIPEFLILQLKVNCAELDYQNFKARQVAGFVEIDNQEVVLKDLKLRTSEGKITLNAETNKKDDIFLVYCRAQLEQVNIRHLFYQFNNFGQDYLTYNHLEGKLNSKLQLHAEMDQALKFDLSTLFVTSDISILNGRLIDFKPITELTGFIKLKKMEDISFDKLENTILISDNTITIPYMDIVSSALSMSLTGSHSFDNYIDYHFKVNVSELFLKKHNPDFNNENAEEDKSGVNMYIHMYGNADDFKFKLDKKAVKTKLGEGLQKEKKDLKDIFQKKKNTQQNTSDNNKESEFEFEWDEK